MARRAGLRYGGNKIGVITIAVLATSLSSHPTVPIRDGRSEARLAEDLLTVVSGQPALAADQDSGSSNSSSTDAPDFFDGGGNSDQTPPAMVPPEVSPGGSSKLPPEIDEATQRIQAKLAQAEAKGIGTSAYKAALNQIVGSLSSNSQEQNLSLLSSLEQNLDGQLKGGRIRVDAIGSGVQYGNLTISAGKPVMTTKFYDKANRPAGIPVPAQFEGFTTWTINPKVNVHWNDSSQVVATANVAMSCEIVTWLPSDASKKLIAHEGGHAKICLKLYERGHLVVREMAQRYLMNRPWRGGQANKEFQAAFQAEVKDVVNWINEDYDKITDHGRNALDSDMAVAESFRRCSEGYKRYLKK
ncbi:MAG: hypothetical protein K2Z81_05680 [Cyanobacteria bacterium]|nr:hypothetical protein [Cyanobacteriota bacterium]